MAGYNYLHTKVFAPESFAGEVLAGHVAWMLDDTYMPKTDLLRQMLATAAEVVHKRPYELTLINSWDALDRYVNYTAVEETDISWNGLYQVSASHFSNAAQENAFYLRFAISTIRTHPNSIHTSFCRPFLRALARSWKYTAFERGDNRYKSRTVARDSF